MSSKRRLRRRSCKSKVFHPDQTSAVRHLISIGSYPYRTYKCKFCSGWHVGRPDKKMRQILNSKKPSVR